MNGDLEKTLELLREAHREPIAEAHYAAVRARVFAKLAEQRRPWRRWLWAYAFAAVALTVFVGRTPLDPPLAQPQPTPVGQALSPATQPPVLASGRRKRLPHQAVGAPAAYRMVGPPALRPLVVKLITNDPNVVIYWISGE